MHFLLSIVLHSIVVLKRTWDMMLALAKSSGLSVPNLAILSFMVMTFMTIYLSQLSFDDTFQFGSYSIKPSKFLIDFQGIFTSTSLGARTGASLGWTSATSMHSNS